MSLAFEPHGQPTAPALERWAPGQPLSSTHLNQVVDAVAQSMRGATAPRQIELKTRQQGGSGFTIVIIRSLDVTAKTMMVQEIAYDDAPLVEGETYKHIVAVGEEFEAFPCPCWSYAMYNIQGGINPEPAEGEDPENLSSAVTWYVDSNLWLHPQVRYVENMDMTDPNESWNGGGGV